MKYSVLTCGQPKVYSTQLVPSQSPIKTCTKFYNPKSIAIFNPKVIAKRYP